MIPESIMSHAAFVGIRQLRSRSFIPQKASQQRNNAGKASRTTKCLGRRRYWHARPVGLQGNESAANTCG